MRGAPLQAQAVVARYFAAFGSGDLSAARGLLTDDLSFQGPLDTFNNADDLIKATQIARSIVARYGMDSTLGPLVYEQERTTFLSPDGQDMSPRHYSEQTAREIDLAARKLVEAAFAESTRILTERRSALERGAQLLLQKLSARNSASAEGGEVGSR